MFTFSGPPIPSPRRGKGPGFDEYATFYDAFAHLFCPTRPARSFRSRHRGPCRGLCGRFGPTRAMLVLTFTFPVPTFLSSHTLVVSYVRPYDLPALSFPHRRPACGRKSRDRSRRRVLLSRTHDIDDAGHHVVGSRPLPVAALHNPRRRTVASRRSGRRVPSPRAGSGGQVLAGRVSVGALPGRHLQHRRLVPSVASGPHDPAPRARARLGRPPHLLARLAP